MAPRLGQSACRKTLIGAMDSLRQLPCSVILLFPHVFHHHVVPWHACPGVRVSSGAMPGHTGGRPAPRAGATGCCSQGSAWPAVSRSACRIANVRRSRGGTRGTRGPSDETLLGASGVRTPPGSPQTVTVGTRHPWYPFRFPPALARVSRIMASYQRCCNTVPCCCCSPKRSSAGPPLFTRPPDQIRGSGWPVWSQLARPARGGVRANVTALLGLL